MKSELDLYLEEPVLPWSNDFDLLNWWKANSSKYKTLQKLARDILAIPISTVASESAFSTSGRFVSPHRSRLHPKTLEALMCAQNLLWADIHENSPALSSYIGCCSTLTEEEIEDEELLESEYVTTMLEDD
ncbi:Zinc finger BED domain-containing protein DAYSLEEPER [Abeliophyllum distichum]|uniref:Zinc finger BED domain-containing protein DAYSLEEPER n=1 Tax=Abeliophyllum distichum TaxID=126358 RepID=A0ABD1W1B3_9LAMI